ncbi:MAG: hypothetical protein IJC39_05195, partial [Firmicutes bacterium]|nr:hypothetical protein [Bacillota bacterium]
MENNNLIHILKNGYLAVGSDNISEIIEFINKSKIQKIEIADWHIRTKYTTDNVDFLKECPSITHLSIHAEAIKDFSAITALPNLKDLYITLSKKSAVKVSVNGLKNLTDLGLENAVEIIGLEDCVNLKTLFLYGYKPKSKDFAALKVLKNLKSFTNRFGNMTSLEGIGGLGVKEAEFRYMRNLEDISDIAGLADNLIDLDFS